MEEKFPSFFVCRSRFSPFQSNGSNANVKKENKFMDSIEKASEGLSDLTEGDECKSLPTLTFFTQIETPFLKLVFSSSVI
mgnify:CR=1 FL=1